MCKDDTPQGLPGETRADRMLKYLKPFGGVQPRPCVPGSLQASSPYAGVQSTIHNCFVGKETLIPPPDNRRREIQKRQEEEQRRITHRSRSRSTGSRSSRGAGHPSPSTTPCRYHSPHIPTPPPHELHSPEGSHSPRSSESSPKAGSEVRSPEHPCLEAAFSAPQTPPQPAPEVPDGTSAHEPVPSPQQTSNEAVDWPALVWPSLMSEPSCLLFERSIVI